VDLPEEFEKKTSVECVTTFSFEKFSHFFYLYNMIFDTFKKFM
jgi:hypothetical protein